MSLSFEEEIALLYLERKARAELASGHFKNFVAFTKPDYEFNWHHDVFCEKLDQFARGLIPRLMLFTPPQNGKSELVSRRLPAYTLGKRPKASVISTSYSADLASRMNRDVQRIMDDQSYREVFPTVGLAGNRFETLSSEIDPRLIERLQKSANANWVRNSELFETIYFGGGYRGAGVGGGITGMGADVAIIDDPIKDKAQADSPVFRQNLWDWYTSTLYTRLRKGGQVLITLTRWHEDDLAGRLLELAKNDPNADQWEVVTFPALREDLSNPVDPRELGEALWPDRYPLDRLLKIKASVGPEVWSGLYQQRPSSKEGGQIKRVWWKEYEALPSHFDQIIQSWDMAFKETDKSDFVVGQVWGRVGADKYLLDQVRARMDFTETVEAVKNLTARWPQAIGKLVEDKANGPAVIATLKRSISGFDAVLPKGGKVSRVNGVAPEIKSGNVFLPSRALAPWIVDFVEECAQFPKGTHDDQVDAMTQALIHFQTANSGDFTDDMAETSGTTVISRADQEY